jgi:hypothetical protein
MNGRTLRQEPVNVALQYLELIAHHQGEYLDALRKEKIATQRSGEGIWFSL